MKYIQFQWEWLEWLNSHCFSTCSGGCDTTTASSVEAMKITKISSFFTYFNLLIHLFVSFFIIFWCTSFFYLITVFSKRKRQRTLLSMWLETLFFCSHFYLLAALLTMKTAIRTMWNVWTGEREEYLESGSSTRLRLINSSRIKFRFLLHSYFLFALNCWVWLKLVQ